MQKAPTNIRSIISPGHKGDAAVVGYGTKNGSHIPLSESGYDLYVNPGQAVPKGI